MQIKDDDVFCAYCGETITQGAPGNAPVTVVAAAVVLPHIPSVPYCN